MQIHEKKTYSQGLAACAPLMILGQEEAWEVRSGTVSSRTGCIPDWKNRAIIKYWCPSMTCCFWPATWQEWRPTACHCWTLWCWHFTRTQLWKCHVSCIGRWRWGHWSLKLCPVTNLLWTAPLWYYLGQRHRGPLPSQDWIILIGPL
jgi:hypothetical protein